jgi:hypothetical protein
VRPEDVKDEFALRFFRWALEDARREIAENYRLIRTVKGSMAMRAAVYLGRLSVDEQLELLTAQAKRAHARGAALAGERLTPRELAILEAKDAATRRALPFEADLGPFAPTMPPRMSRSKLTTAVKRVMGRNWDSLEWMGQVGYFRKVIGDWTISTAVSCGSPPYYFHNVRGGIEKPLMSLGEGISLPAWLGIGQATWEFAHAGEEAETAGAVALLSTHFLGAAKHLLADLALSTSHDGAVKE